MQAQLLGQRVRVIASLWLERSFCLETISAWATPAYEECGPVGVRKRIGASPFTEEMGNQCSLWRLLRRRSADLVYSAQLRVVAVSVSQDWPRMRARTRPRRRSPSTLPLCPALHHNRH